MRDLETIELAITAAATGHLVFGTLHTQSASKTVDRIIDVFPADQQNKIRQTLSEALQGIVAQTLFKRRDKKGRIAAFEVLVFNTAIRNLVREGMAAAEKIAADIAQKAPLAVKAAKRSFNVTEDLPLDSGYRFEQSQTVALASTEDTKEALKAFAEKRKPIFRNR